jgi:hypothetical protein
LVRRVLQKVALKFTGLDDEIENDEEDNNNVIPNAGIAVKRRDFICQRFF